MPPKEAGNTEKVQVFFSKETLSLLKKEAQEKGTSVSGLVRMIVNDYTNKEEQRMELAMKRVELEASKDMELKEFDQKWHGKITLANIQQYNAERDAIYRKYSMLIVSSK